MLLLQTLSVCNKTSKGTSSAPQFDFSSIFSLVFEGKKGASYTMTKETPTFKRGEKRHYTITQPS